MRHKALIYAALSSMGALALAVGLAVLRTVQTIGLTSWAVLRGELYAECLTYGYVALSTLAVALVAGMVVGAKLTRLEQLSLTDSLTQLSNRRAFVHVLDDELARAWRYDAELSVLMLDLDYFKQVNDRFGHAAGDQALRLLADCLRSSCRGSDSIARLGGDEFAVLLPSTRADKALELAGRLRARCAALAEKGDAPLPLTLSIGIADRRSLRGGGPQSLSLLAAADAALYTAKQMGRDPRLCGAAGANGHRPRGF